MKIKHQELEIDQDKPFKNCKLNREPYAHILTDIVQNYADGFVLALTSEWGTGKTTFVKMWRQHLHTKGFQTAYFNAWENDFDSNPMIALMSELKPPSKAPIAKTRAFNSVVKKGAVLAKNVFPALAKAVASKHMDSDVFIEAISGTVKAATDIFEDEMKQYATKKKTISEFRVELQKFVKEKNNNKPLVFIVDELDRCRPNYSVEVLEQVKHFFSVPGIVFVLSIDKKHLASAVTGFYNSTNINTEEYLRRFIDLEYSIPQPSNRDFCNYLYGYFGLDEYFTESRAQRYPEVGSDAPTLLETAYILFDTHAGTLRQQENIFAQSRLILSTFKEDQYTFAPLLFALIFVKTMKNDLFQKIQNNKLTCQSLYDEFTDLIPIFLRNEYNLDLTKVLAHLLHFYNNKQPHEFRTQLLVRVPELNHVMTTSIQTKIEHNQQDLAQALQQVTKHIKYSGTSLDYLLTKIRLTQRFLSKAKT
ncbi:MAG TPA: P-loop NTPase fold protein [Chryseolinea sp.]|nr:P-loop NTPase fold protein [Chryseolinea sp.]